jgi:3-oxoacyl-[acyl-carrier-protein] synthase-1
MSIAGLGACTPIGRNVWASAAAARAGLCGFCEHPFMVDTAGEPMRVARAPWVDWRVEGVDRLAALLLPAIDEALGELDRTSAGMSLRLGLVLALPASRPGLPAASGEALIARIAARRPGRFIAAPVFEIGHAAAYPALDAAISALGAASLDACLVCGVDSYLAPETLEWVEACDQLHGGGALNNAWGFIPGEAAGTVLLASSALFQRTGLAALAEVSAVGIGCESKLIKSDDVCIGEGLTQAFRSVFERLAPGEHVDGIFCDMNGEPYRADEYGFTALRTREHLRAAGEFNSPADCWGDVGAAGGFLHVALAAIAHHKRYARGPISMAWGSSESGERGAALIRDALVARGG